VTQRRASLNAILVASKEQRFKYNDIITISIANIQILRELLHKTIHISRYMCLHTYVYSTCKQEYTRQGLCRPEENRRQLFQVVATVKTLAYCHNVLFERSNIH